MAKKPIKGTIKLDVRDSVAERADAPAVCA